MRRTTLGELVRETGGSIKTGPFGTTLKAAEYSQNDGVPVISVGEIRVGKLIVDRKTPRVGDTVVQRLPEYLLETGDVVFGRKGAVDRSACVREHERGYFLGSDGIRVRFGNGVLPRFIAYQIQSKPVRDWLVRHAAGTTMASLNQSILERVPLVVPPLHDQAAVVDVLGAFDDKIFADEHQAEKSSDLASASFMAARRQAKETQTLSDLVSTQYGVTTSAIDSLGPRLLRVTDINKKPWVEWATTPSCRLDDGETTKYRLHAGDILVSRMADPGRAALIDEGDPEAVFASYLVRLSAHSPENAPYIYYFIRSAEYRHYADAVSSGSVQRNMNAKVIVGIRIPMPDNRVLAEFGAWVTSLRRSIGAVLRQANVLAETRNELLPLLMSGKVRVRDAERQAEAVL